jgi:hypothetical protein
MASSLATQISLIAWIVRVSLHDTPNTEIYLGTGLLGITADKTAQAMQVSDSNPLVGLEGRSSLLYRLGSALKESPQYFGSDSRPGNIVGNLNDDYVLNEVDSRQIFSNWNP